MGQLHISLHVSAHGEMQRSPISELMIASLMFKEAIVML